MRISVPFAGALTAWILVLTTAPASATPTSDPSISRDMLSGIDAMRKLPVDGMHVVEARGRLLIVSTNGHYVIEGRILDLWNGIEVHSAADVDATLRLPLAKMGIHAADLGGIRLGDSQSNPLTTVFLDPGSGESPKLLAELRPLLNSYRIDVIFVPARPDRAAVTRALICDPVAATAFLKEGKVPPAPPADAHCGERELAKASVTVHLLGIRVLPYTVAPNGTGIEGHPRDYAHLLSANREPQS
jgi:thiol:disulfide interchange protein DsbC